MIARVHPLFLVALTRLSWYNMLQAHWAVIHLSKTEEKSPLIVARASLSPFFISRIFIGYSIPFLMKGGTTMRCFVKTSPVLCIILLICGAPSLRAQWVEDGAAVCTAGKNQDYPELIADGAGGVIITWRDDRGTSADVYAQRVDRYGNALWAANGVAVCTAAGDQHYPRIVPDGAGGAIITWHDGRSGWDIYAQRIDSDGNPLWTADGVAVCAAAGDQYYPEIAPDGSGGAIIAWMDMRSGDFDVYAQNVDAGGTMLWTAGGVAVSAVAASNQSVTALVSDGAGGAIIVWEDWRNGNEDVYADRLGSAGNSVWILNGLPICNATGGQGSPVLVTDGSSGAIITWTDYRGGNADIYAQWIASAANVKWTFNGIAVCSATNDQVEPEIDADGAGGVIIAWADYRSGTNYDIYAQRIDPDGNGLWTANGVDVCTAAGAQYNVDIAGAGDGGVILAWEDERLGSPDNYAQRLDAMGSALWATNGVGVCTASGSQALPRLIADDTGRAIITWYDERIAGNQNIFAQRLDPTGNWGFPEPVIEFVRDVPGDQGGYVTAAWNASQYDPLGQITEYTIWRAISGPAALAIIESGAPLLRGAAEITPDIDRGAIRREVRGGSTFYWEMIDSHDAYYIESYAKVVPTTFDSTAVCDEYHYFQIIAHTSAPLVFWVSEPDSGYSVDNLAPCPPLGLAGEQQHLPEGLLITWDPNTEFDLDGYAVYRGLTEDFVPGPGSLLAAPCDTFTFDGEWRWDSAFFYKVAAIDVHGNESGCALLRPTDITGGETPDVPRASFLAQNVPNPFNPMTTISFGIAEPAHVTLRIYDAAGRLVRVLVNERRPAGRYDITWDGHDGAGRTAASGVYFYRLNAGAFEKTRKMVLLK